MLVKHETEELTKSAGNLGDIWVFWRQGKQARLARSRILLEIADMWCKGHNKGSKNRRCPIVRNA